jgi:RNA polymerase sigma-70 factor (ECF subfamily)
MGGTLVECRQPWKKMAARDVYRMTNVRGMHATLDRLREQIVELLPRLRRFARTLARDPHDADDLVQLAVERALARSEQLRPDASLSSWMFGILRNAWIDETRTRGRRNRLFAPEEMGENVSDAASEALSETLSVQDAMARLPEEQRMAIGLVLVEGLSYKEAAEIMGIPVGTLTSRLARGREALQTLLADTTGAVQ